MKTFRWNHEKNEHLKAEREVSFEEIVLAMEGDGLLDILQRPNESKYPNQRILVVALDSYIHLIPFVEEADYYFPAARQPEITWQEEGENEKNRRF